MYRSSRSELQSKCHQEGGDLRRSGRFFMLIQETIILDAAEEEIARAIDSADKFANANSISESIRRRVDIVLDDALMNVVSHGFSDPTGQKIQLTLELKPDKLDVVISDYGRAFDPTSKPSNESDIKSQNIGIEDVQLGGLGIGLIRQLSDQIVYKRIKSQNILTLSFLIKRDDSQK